MKFKPKLGNIIVLFGIMGIIISLINESMPLLAKAIICIISCAVTVFGVLVETPVLGYLNEGSEKEFKDVDYT